MIDSPDTPPLTTPPNNQHYRPPTGWINLPLAAGSTSSSIIVNLAPLNGAVPTAVRYGWGVLNCCDLTDPTTFTSKDCLANCPIMSTPSGLPANPFIAKIAGGKCECLPPQVCSA